MRAILLLSCLAFFAQAGWCEDPAQSPPILITNYKDGETIRYSVPILRGKLADAALTSITVENASSDRDTRRMQGLALNGQFKALAELVPGPNKLTLRAGKNELSFNLEYKPQTNPYFVRAIYLTDNTGDTAYQTPVENDPQDYAGKLDTVLKIMQSFTAERLNDFGYGRRTFNLELDDKGKVKVHVVKCASPAQAYYDMPDQVWYANVAAQLEKKHPTALAKNFVVAAYTRFDPETKKPKGHTALGGGGQGLFGSGNMFTWPGKLADAQGAFMDTRPIDKEKFFSDSIGRHTFWGAASTTIGACLHEISHAFGLPHTKEPMDIMTRGFDHFNRAFTLSDPPSSRNKEAIAFQENRIACFSPISAAALAPSRWFALDKRDYNEGARTRINLDENAVIRIESDAIVRYVGFSVKGDAVFHAVPDAVSKRFSIPLAAVKEKIKADEFSIRVLDDCGNMTMESSKTLLAGPFVRKWQFAPLTLPWKDTKKFTAADERKLKEIDAAATSKPLAADADRFVDFAPHFQNIHREYVAGYALRVIKSDRARTVKFFTGSDDALRVWLNGTLVQQVLAMRGAKVDAESCTAELKAGENRLLVEVSQLGGGWGLFFRIEDAGGVKLALEDDGTLREVPSAGK